MDPHAHEIALACKGFLDDEEGLRLHDLARDHARLGAVLEIGSYCGKSSVYLGTGVRSVSGTLICVDHHRGNEEQQPGWGFHDSALVDPEVGRMDSLPFLRHTLREAGLEETAVVIVGQSAEVARIVTASLGMVFIDGGHTLEAVVADYQGWAPKVAPGGILAIHDLFDDPSDGGQAPIEVYRRARDSGRFEELPRTKTLGVLRRLRDTEDREPGPGW
jgi:predicted O-methyltransferase YrrM